MKLTAIQQQIIERMQKEGLQILHNDALNSFGGYFRLYNPITKEELVVDKIPIIGLISKGILQYSGHISGFDITKTIYDMKQFEHTNTQEIVDLLIDKLIAANNMGDVHSVEEVKAKFADEVYSLFIKVKIVLGIDEEIFEDEQHEDVLIDQLASGDAITYTQSIDNEELRTAIIDIDTELNNIFELL